MSFERPSPSFSTPPQGAEASLGGLTAPDVLQMPTPGTLGGAEAAQSAAAAAQAKVSAEAAVLGSKAIAAVGNAAITAVPMGGGEISPLVQLIMKMPGCMGVASSLFEWLQNLFCGGDLIKLFDPLQASLGSLGTQMSMLSHLATGAQQFGVSLAHNISGDGMMKMMTSAGQGPGSLDFSKLSGTSEHFMVDPANVGAQADFSKAQFETSKACSIEGITAGPALSQVSHSNFLAGNFRMFTDRLGSGGHFNSLTSATSVPSTTGIPANSSGATFGQEVNALSSAPEGITSGPAFGNSAINSVAPAHSAMESAASSTSAIERFGANNVVASDVPSYRPSSGNYWTPNADSVSSSGANSVEYVQPLKAKQLSFADMHKQSAGGSKNVVDYQGHQSKPVLNQGDPIDGIAHKAPIPKAYTTHASAGPHASTSSAHHASAAKPAAHHAPRRVEAASKPAVRVAEQSQAQVAYEQAPAENISAAAEQGQEALDQGTVAQAGDAAAGNVSQAPASYMVQRGDSLWNIAQKNLGDGSRWTEIYRLNADTIGADPDMIFAGTELKLPGMEQQVASAGKYVVQPGDNLWDIAQSNMGDATKWTEIYQANAGVIGSNPDLILPGQELNIPGVNATVASNVDPSALNTAQGVTQSVPGTMPNTAQVAYAQPSMQAQWQAQPQMQPQMAEAAQMQAQMQPVAQQQYAAQQFVPQQQFPVEAAATAGGTTQPVLQAQPAQELPAGPGAAGAATLKPAAEPVSASLAPDLSFLDKR